MRRTKFPLLLATTFFAFIMPIVPRPALAQQSLTFVSATGSDNQICTAFSPCCTLGAPCHTLQFAHDHTSAGGEIETLDRANYGQLFIGKAISIYGHGYAEVNGAFFAPIIVLAGANDRINLDGLIIDGGLPTGINFSAGHSLTVTHCVFRRLDTGIMFNAFSGQLTVSDTFMTDVGDGMNISPSGGPTIVAINRLQAYNNDTGIRVTADKGNAVFMMITDSVIHGSAGLAGTGMILDAHDGGVVTAHLLRSTLSENSVGMSAAKDTIVRLGQSAVHGTNAAFTGTGGLESFGDNAFVPHFFPVPSIPKK